MRPEPTNSHGFENALQFSTKTAIRADGPKTLQEPTKNAKNSQATPKNKQNARILD